MRLSRRRAQIRVSQCRCPRGRPRLARLVSRGGFCIHLSWPSTRITQCCSGCAELGQGRLPYRSEYTQILDEPLVDLHGIMIQVAT